MKEIPLTKGFVAIIDDEDFNLVSRFNWCAQIAPRTVYAVTQYGPTRSTRTSLLLHRLIMQPPKGLVVHHEDDNGLNNRRDNLSNITYQEHNRLCRTRENRTGCYRGVYPVSIGKYKAVIQVNGSSHHLGTFVSEYEAALAYDKAAQELYKGQRFTLNFPEGVRE